MTQIRSRFVPSPVLRLLARAAVLLALAPVVPVAGAQPLAALEITPTGSQTFDLSTGITTLPEGGVVTDAELGATLRGSFVRYRDDDFVEITDAEITWPAGRILAPFARLDLQALELHADGGVQFALQGLAFRADAVVVFLRAEVARADGAVRGELPPLEAERAYVDLRDRTAVLEAPYSYRDGPVSLRREEAGGVLTLVWSDDDASNGFVFEARTDPLGTLPERLAPFAP